MKNGKQTNGKNGKNGQSSSKEKAATVGYQFGTFKGVYTPSILTILGVIMYLRLGWVLGNVGLFGTLLIITMATCITAVTALSVSALVTNMRIGGGGAYYILSRSLGVEMGAAIGLPLFLAQALGISFYIAGFSESLASIFPFLDVHWIGMTVLVALTAVAIFSADVALRMQFFILALIASSLVSFFFGGAPKMITLPPPNINLDIQPFWAVFAVFFPAVTGIEAGLALSGDLKDPDKALPWGTLGAVFTSYLVYMAIPIFLSYIIKDTQLFLIDPLIMKDVAFFGHLVLLGLWGASLSSALGALLGAPRTLQALARDRVAPQFLSQGEGENNEPRRAIAVTFLIAACGVLAGGINVIAPMLTIFFLTSYGLLNLSAAFEGMIGSPSWRPKLKVPWGLSMLGALGCLAVTFMINPGAMFIATFVSGIVYATMRRRNMKAFWGDMRYGILMLMARYSLFHLAERAPNIRTWRPNIIVLSGSPTSRWYLIALADAISHGKGFLTVATIVPEKVSDGKHIQSIGTSVSEYLKKRRVPALVKIHSSDDVLEGARQLIKSYGFGPMTPNTVLLGETERIQNIHQYVKLIQVVHQMHRNLVIVRESDEPFVFSWKTRIDLWWSHTSHNGGLMLALAFLLKTSPEWRRSHLVLKTIVGEDENKEEATRGLKEFLKNSRVDADVQVLVHNQGDVFDAIRKSSKGAGLVFMGMRAPKEDESVESYARYYAGLMARTDGFPAMALVLAAEQLNFDQIFAAPA